MNATIKDFPSGAILVPASKKVPNCPWQRECIWVREVKGNHSDEGCASRLEKATCKWLLQEEGFTAISLIVSDGEISVKRIGEWFGFSDNAVKLARVRDKLNVCVECEFLAVRRGPSKQGENLYRLGSNAGLIVQLCVAKFNARSEAVGKESKELDARAKDRAQLCEKMKRLKLP